MKAAFVAAFAVVAGYGIYLIRKQIICRIWCWLMWKHWLIMKLIQIAQMDVLVVLHIAVVFRYIPIWERCIGSKNMKKYIIIADL